MRKILCLWGLAYIFLALAGQAAADSLKDAQRAYSEGDFAKAAKLVRPLAEKGDVKSQSMLGAVLLESGQHNPKDFKEAAKWFRLAGAQGDAPAQTNLGTMYAAGLGVTQDFKEAVKWYRLAGLQGIAFAQLNLGMMYAEGYGIPKNYKEAVKWYQLAAKQGDAGAQSNLGTMYANGQGVVQDYVLAYMWVNIAASNRSFTGNRKALIEHGDSIAGRMTTQQVTEAQNLAKKCIAHKFKGC